MDARLTEIVAHVQNLQANGDPMAASARLQQTLNDMGLKHAFTESQLREAMDAIGIDPDDQDSWFEEMASWL